MNELSAQYRKLYPGEQNRMQQGGGGSTWCCLSTTTADFHVVRCHLGDVMLLASNDFCHHRLPPMIASMRRNLISRRHWLPPTLSNALGARVQPDFGPRSKHNPAVKQDTMLFYRALNDGAIELKRGREKKKSRWASWSLLRLVWFVYVGPANRQPQGHQTVYDQEENHASEVWSAVWASRNAMLKILVEIEIEQMCYLPGKTMNSRIPSCFIRSEKI